MLAERQGAKLLDGAVSLLPDQLMAPEADDEAVRAYLGCLPMAQTGYEEEARLYAQATLLPGSESGGFGQNDVASPVFLAWSKHDRAGRCLDMALASLVPIALRAFDVTDRPVPPRLARARGRRPRDRARLDEAAGIRPRGGLDCRGAAPRGLSVVTRTGWGNALPASRPRPALSGRKWGQSGFSGAVARAG